MYETLAVWETDSTLAAQSDLTADYASAWQAADKVVYSSTLAAPPTARTRLERHFDPSAVLDLKAAASRDLLVGGPNLAAQALVAGLVDELALFVWPSSSVGATPHCRPTRAPILSSSTSTDSAAASSTSATAFSDDAGNRTLAHCPERRVSESPVWETFSGQHLPA